MSIDELIEIAKTHHPAQIKVLADMALAMSRPVFEDFDNGSDIATENFRLSFRNWLTVHHATNELKLTKKHLNTHSERRRRQQDEWQSLL